MKALIKIACLFFVSLLLFNCSNDDDNLGDSNQEFSPELLNGTWRVSLFTDESSNLTAEFNGYEFTFNLADELLIITYNGESMIEEFEVFQENIDNENIWIIGLEIRNIENLGDADLGDLDENWFVTEVTANPTIIKLGEQESNNTPEVLHLTKL